MIPSQEVPASLRYKFRVYLRDKGETDFSLDDPQRFLSSKAIERRERQGVVVDELDLPISKDYFALVELAGGKVVACSKWLSTLTVEMNDSLDITRIESLPFVDSVKYVWRGVDRPYRTGLRPRLVVSEPCNAVVIEVKEPESSSPAVSPFVESPHGNSLYGITEGQFKLHNAIAMGDAGYRGKGITVGVIDAGFTNLDVIPWFSTMDLQGFKDIVPGGEMFSASSHGTKVLSTMVMNCPGKMMGSAPNASYWLFRSEDVDSEFPVEEDYWVRAIEYADSVGVDLVNSSLGYNHFNDSSLNYTHDDLTGRISIMSKAADLAFKKGMIVVTSAGNEGNKIWRKSTPPGDAKNVLSVGAVGTDSVIASFSSRGVMADGRIKPDLVSVGRSTVTVGQDGLIGFTNGTSLSSPFLAGLIASLWSINPELHRTEVVDIVLKSSDRYASPDSIYGYGIPDFQKAMKEVLSTLPEHLGRVTDDRWSIEPEIDYENDSVLCAASEIGFNFGDVNNFLVKVLDRAFSGDAYRVRLLDESGLLISEHSIAESDTVIVSLQREVRENNSHIHFMIEEPFRQYTYRMRLR